MFGVDPQHTQNSALVFPSSSFKLAWNFHAGDHIWSHTSRRSVWSSSGVAAEIDGTMRFFIGSYTNNVFCLEAETGKELWRFPSGGPVNAAPVFFRAGDKAFVIAVSSDRIIYCLDARTGEKVWSYEVYPWKFTVFEAVSTSPIVIVSGNTRQLIVSLWYADRKPLKNIQKGEVIALNAVDGTVSWRKTVSDSYIFSPAFAEIDGSRYLYISSSDGVMYCLAFLDGTQIWKFSSSVPLSSSPLITKTKARDVVIAGTPFGILYCLDAKNGKKVWEYKAGMNIVNTGCVCPIDGRNVLFVPSFDRFLHCIDVNTGTMLWRFETKKYIASSPIGIKIGDVFAVIVASLDNNLYCLDARSGKVLWQFSLGKRLWAFETRAETLWPSPIALSLSNKTPFLIVPWYDGSIYAFTVS